MKKLNKHRVNVWLNDKHDEMLKQLAALNPEYANRSLALRAGLPLLIQSLNVTARQSTDWRSARK